MTFNIDLAVRVLARIEESLLPDTPAWEVAWNQTTWGRMYSDVLPITQGDLLYDEGTGTYVGWGTCGTAMCFAGHALTEEKVKMVWTPAGGSTEFFADRCVDGDLVSDRACALLGIDPPADRYERDEEAEGEDEHWDYSEDFPMLFNGGNDLDHIYAEVSHYSGEPVGVLKERALALAQRTEVAHLT